MLWSEPVDAALRWVSFNSDVVVTGPPGSGRSSVLAHVARLLRSRDRQVVTLAGLSTAADLPFGAIATHPTLSTWLETRPTLATVATRLRAALGTDGVLLVDDAHLLDPLTLALVESARSHGRTTLVVAGDTTHPSVRRLTRQAQRVRCEPLGVRRTTLLLTDHEGREVEASLAAQLTTQSGGNPTITLMLFDAARFSGAIGLVDGVWRETSPLDDVPTTGLVDTLTLDLSPESLDALRLLAWRGPVDLTEARQLVPGPTVGDLASAGLVLVHRVRQELEVVLAPPLLARALRAGLSTLDVHDLTVRVSRPSGRSDLAARRIPTTGSAYWWAEAAQSAPDAVDQALAESVSVLSERLHVRLASLWERWRADPRPEPALPLLRLLLIQDTTVLDALEVLRSTVVRLDDRSRAVASFLMLRAQLRKWSPAMFATATGHDTPDAPSPEHLFSTILDALPTDRSPVLTARALPTTTPPGLEKVVELVRGLAALESGRPASALTTSDDQTDEPILAEHLNTVHGDALVLQGRVSEAVEWNRRLLSRASDDLDPLALRFAARGLATALFVAGDTSGSWRAISAVLRLGHPGPLSSPYDVRTLSIAAVIRARAGDTALAATMLREIEPRHRSFSPGLDFVVPWAEAEIGYARRTGATDASARLWEAGERFWRDGAATSALACWCLRASVATAEELAQLEALSAEAQVPLFAPLVEAHRQLSHGTSTQVLRALRPLTVGGPLVRLALQTATSRRAEEGGEALTREQIFALGGPALERSWGSDPLLPADGRLSLTPRESEIAELARAGASNKEIATTFVLSVRTVENHMRSILKKLGMGSRADLRRWDPAHP